MRLGEADRIGGLAIQHAHLGMGQVVQFARGVLARRLDVGIVDSLGNHGSLRPPTPLPSPEKVKIPRRSRPLRRQKRRFQAKQRRACWAWPQRTAGTMKRSEEHTSELQSLMRNS